MTKQIAKGIGNAMGFKTMNFHGTIHVPQDILNFGVPTNVNTRANEHHHKRDKGSALRTNKRHLTFDISTATKIHHRGAVDLGMEELKGRPRWKYFHGFDHSDKETTLVDCFSPKLAGCRARVFKNTDLWFMRVNSQMKAKTSTNTKNTLFTH